MLQRPLEITLGTYDYLDPWRWDGLEYDLFWGTAPFNYPALWWDAVPYHFADDNYYAWHAGAQAYEAEHSSPEVTLQSAAADATATDLFAYPKSDQNPEQKAHDRYECHRWATDQMRFDPTRSGDVPPAASTPAGDMVVTTTAAEPIKRQDYLNAQAACLVARGYSVK
jgi:hypothetical protein